MSSYETIYSGVQGYTPTYKPLSQHNPAVSQLGLPINPLVANQVGDLNIKLNTGMKIVEAGPLQPKHWEAIPQEHIDDMRRLFEMSGVKPTFHAPMIEASGVDLRAGKWDEINREGAERQLTSAIIRSNTLSKEGNVNVTTHTTYGIPEMEGKFKDKETGMLIINKESGSIQQLPKSKKYLSESGEFIPGTPVKDSQEQQLKQINKDQWVGNVAQINRMAEYAERDLGEAFSLRTKEGIQSIYSLEPKKEAEIKEVLKLVYNKKYDPSLIDEPVIKAHLNEIKRGIEHGKAYARESYSQMKNLFDNVYPTTSGADREKLDAFAKRITPLIEGGIDKDPSKVIDFLKIVDEGSQVLNNVKEAPQIFVPMQEFVIDKSTDTFSNVAINAYKKYQNKSPIISIENPPGGEGLSKGEDVARVVEETRRKFAEKLVKDFSLSKSEAKRVAEEKIGATWDVGHINMLRKYGYTEQDLIQEAKKVAPFVKKVHLSDNFGMEHTELPMGMGNVPLKEMMRVLEKQGFKGPQIIEAGDWWSNFIQVGGGSPFIRSLESMNSPVYAMAQSPGWSNYQMGGYYSGYGAINPAQHHSLYGAGFTTLPMELGGSMPGSTTDKFSGTPMQ